MPLAVWQLAKTYYDFLATCRTFTNTRVCSGFQHKASEPILLSSRCQSVRDWWLQLSTILALPRGWKRRLQSVGDVAPIKAG